MTHLLANILSQQLQSAHWDEIKNILWHVVKQTVKKIHTALITINKKYEQISEKKKDQGTINNLK